MAWEVEKTFLLSSWYPASVLQGDLVRHSAKVGATQKVVLCVEAAEQPVEAARSSISRRDQMTTILRSQNDRQLLSVKINWASYTKVYLTAGIATGLFTRQGLLIILSLLVSSHSH